MRTLIHKTLMTAVLAPFLSLAAPLGAQLEPDSEPVSLGPLGGSAINIVVNPLDADEILIVKYTLGIFRSTDGGDTFDLAPYGTGISGNVRHLRQDPSNPATLYAADGNQIYKSTNFGVSWNPLSLVGLYSNLKDIAIAPTGNNMLALDAFNVYHSADGGTTWNVVFDVVPFAGVVIDQVEYAPSNGSVAYLLTTSAGIYRSDTGGSSFVTAGTFSGFADTLIVSASDEDTLFIGTNFDGMFVSTDGSFSFSSIVDPDIDGNSHWFAQEPNGTLWFATLTSLSYSTDGGTNWLNGDAGWPINTPIPANMAFAPGGKRFLGCEGGGLNDQSGGGLYSMPSGTPTAWTHIGFLTALINDVAIAGPGGLRIIGIGAGVYAGAPGLTPTPTAWHADIGTDTRSVAVDPSDPTRWVTGGLGAFFDNAQIIVETGNGSAFVKTYERFGAGIVQDIQFDPNNADKLVAGIFPGGFGNVAIVRSSNGGDAWTEVGGTTGWATRAVAFDPHTPGFVVQLSDNNQWAASANSGVSWSSLAPAWPGSGPAVLLAYDPFEHGVIYRGDTGDGLWRSDDSGANWINLGVPLHTNSDLLLHPQFPDLMWVSDVSGQILVSTDRGNSFDVALDLPLGTNGASLALDTANGNLLIGTTSASTWELPGAAPGVKLGSGTVGTGGFVPEHFLSNGLAQIGSPDFAIGGNQFRGGSTVFLAYGLGEVAVPAFGGSFHVGTLLNVFAFPVGGGVGVGGGGAFDITFALPLDPLLVGFSIYTQCGALDQGVSHPDGIALSNALKITFHN